LVALVASVSVILAACSGSERATPPRPPSRTEVVVASFNFPESVLLAEIYAEALEAAGIPVRRELGLGPRELVQPALVGGLVDLVPEYLGSALASLDPDADPAAADVAVVRRRLEEAVSRRGLSVLQPAAASNQNGVAVVRATADRLGAPTLSGLAGAAGGVSLAGPPECLRRPYCLPGLERAYGLRFTRFVPLETERQRLTALREHVVDAAVVFTTDGELALGDLVLLEDDRRLQPAENVTPVVSQAAVERYGARLVEPLRAVSALLTSENLRFLNWRVSVAGSDPRVEARGWLARNGLVAR
jgi:osmoprotectant transport system substrate-binding protein